MCNIYPISLLISSIYKIKIDADLSSDENVESDNELYEDGFKTYDISHYIQRYTIIFYYIH